jgi:hypothetical protein
MSIRVVDFTKWEKNGLKGFITVAITDDRTGIEIILPGFALFGKGSVGIELPGMRDKNGAYQKDLKTMYLCDPIMEKQFKNIIIKELEKYFSQHNDKVEEPCSLPEDLIKFD